MRSIIVIFVVQGQSIRCPSCHQNFITGHSTADLGQAHDIAGYASRIHGIGDRQIGIIGHHFGGFSQSFFKWIGRVI